MRMIFGKILASMGLLALLAGCMMAPVSPQQVRVVLPDPPVYVHDANRPCTPPNTTEAEKWATELEPQAGESGQKNKYRSARVAAGSFGLDCAFLSNSSSSTSRSRNGGK